MKRVKFLKIRQEILLSVVVLLLSFAAAFSKTIYVDDDASGANDGSSWTNAYAYLQDALGDAALSQEPVEVLVAQGLYIPDQGKDQTPGDRKASFELINGVSIIGGYAGISEPDPDVRDIAVYSTILSGDLNRNDVEVDSPYEFQGDPTRAENSYHVVISNRTNNTAVLDGFILVAGNTNGHRSDAINVDKHELMRGGGIYNVSGSPLVVDCIFIGNSAVYGGGIGNWKGNPNIIDCTFIWNAAARYGGGIDNCEGESSLINCTFCENSASWGGGMSNRTGGNSTLIDCRFKMNEARWYGGGMNNASSHPELTGCTFTRNKARLGGAIRNSDSSPVFTNCLIVENVAHCPYGPYGWGTISGRGGGVYNSKSFMTLMNCTVSGNRAAIRAGGICGSQSTMMLKNCILWNNGLQQISGDATVLYSNIQGGWPGEGNLDVDPLFVRPNRLETNSILANACNDMEVEGDYHLKSKAGRWDSAQGDWTIDEVSSPCIDAGEPLSPIGFEPAPNGDVINMGFYGGTAEASMSENLPVFGLTDP